MTETELMITWNFGRKGQLFHTVHDEYIFVADEDIIEGECYVVRPSVDSPPLLPQGVRPHPEWNWIPDPLD